MPESRLQEDADAVIKAVEDWLAFDLV